MTKFSLKTQLLLTVGQLPAEIEPWRWAAASQIGTSHLRSGQPRQDAYSVRHLANGQLFAIVSDGAGSAEFGRQGAWILCRTLTTRFQVWFQENGELPADEEIKGWIDDFRDCISHVAEAREVRPRQFASTLSSITITPSGILALQVGDSALVGRRDGVWESILWPENGEYASTTFFVTDPPEPRLNIVRETASFDAFALFSDGVGEVALEHVEQRPYTKFFEPMINPIVQSEEVGRLVQLSKALGNYLDRPEICERTDDDKTLILISAA